MVQLVRSSTEMLLVKLTSSSSRFRLVNKDAHSFCIPSSIVGSGGGFATWVGVVAGDRGAFVVKSGLGVAGVATPNKLEGAFGVGEEIEVPFRLNDPRLKPVPVEVAGVVGVWDAPPNIPKVGGVGGVLGGLELARGFKEAKGFGVEGGAEGCAGDAAVWLLLLTEVPKREGDWGGAMFPNRPKEVDAETGGGTVDGARAAVAGFALPKSESGGVRGLIAVFDADALPLSGSVLVGLSGGRGRTAKRGWGETGGFWECTTVKPASPPSSSSSWETGALARGELRVGRVLGRPRPIPKGVEGVGLTDDGGDGAVLPKYDEGSLSGDPGGVVLSSLIVGKPEGEDEPEESEGVGEGVIWMAGTSGWGVAEGEREGGNGTDAGSGERSPSSEELWSSDSEESSSSWEGTYSLPEEMKDCESLSDPSSSPSGTASEWFSPSASSSSDELLRSLLSDFEPLSFDTSTKEPVSDVRERFP
jgi:hypothetical protein